MAEATQQQPGVTSMPGPATDIEKHQENVKRRAAKRAEGFEKRLDCLDPETAATHEARKRRFRYLVSCNVTRTDKKGRRRTERPEHLIEGAQGEDHAWALFCDAIGTWPSPHTSRRRIQQLNKDEAEEHRDKLP